MSQAVAETPREATTDVYVSGLVVEYRNRNCQISLRIVLG